MRFFGIAAAAAAGGNRTLAAGGKLHPTQQQTLQVSKALFGLWHVIQLLQMQLSQVVQDTHENHGATTNQQRRVAASLVHNVREGSSTFQTKRVFIKFASTDKVLLGFFVVVL
jgi:hypothetical protein